MRRLLHAAVAATVAFAVYAVGATLFAAPAEARSARGTDGILYQPYLNNRVVFEGTGEVDNVYTSNRGTDIDPDTPGIQVRGTMYFVTGCFAPRRPGTLAVTARIVSGDRGAVGVVVRTNGALPCVYAWAKTDADRDNDSVRVTATAVLTNNGTEVDRFEDTFTVEQRDMISGVGGGVGVGVGEGAPLDLTAPPPRTFTAGAAINVPALPAASGGSGHYIYALTGRGGAARPSWIRFDSTGRRMSGTPPSAAGAVTLDYTVDDGNASVTRSFTVTVNAALSLSAPANRTYTVGKAIQAFTLSPATGGTAPLRYELSGLPGGLEFFGSTRRVTGTPLAATATPATVTCKVTDANGAVDTETFTVTVLAVLAVDAPLDMALREGQALRETILPAATGGDGNYNYEITPALPEGLAFDSGTRLLSGTPESGQARTRYSYSVGDGAGNFAEATFTIAVATGADTTAPTVRSVERHDGTNAQGEHTNADTLTFRVTFNEDVRYVDTADFDASGTSGSDVSLVTAVPGSPTQYIVTVGGGTKGGTLASHDGEVGLTFASGQDIADWSGNALTATTPTGADETYTLDNTAPTVRMWRADGAATTLNTAFDVTVFFAEANGLQTSGPGAFTAADLAVTNGDATAVTATVNPRLWAARIVPDAGLTDNVLVDLPANRVRDRAGNGNLAATRLSVPVDNVVPTPVLSASPATHDGSSTSVVTIDFGESMAGFGVADIGVSGGSASGFTGGYGSSIYTVTVTPSGFPSVVVSVAAGVATDRAGNANLAADDLVVRGSFSWTATLTVDEASDYSGYCSLRCNSGVGVDLDGSLVDDGGDNAFDIPGTTDSVAVTMLAYRIPSGDSQVNDATGMNLYLRLTPHPSRSVYSAWTLNVGGREASFSDASVIQDNRTSVLRFQGFYPSANDAPGVGATAAVCIRNATGSCGGTSGTSGATAARAAAEAPEAGLAARFGALPEWHAGMAFWTELHFSEAPNLSYLDVRDKLFEVTGGRLLRAQRLEQDSNRSWRLEVLPAGFGDLTLTLPATEDCAAEGAVCTADGERMEAPVSVMVPGPGERLAARLTGFTTRHDGKPFEPELWFNHAPNLSFRDVRDTLFEVTGGRITRARRQQQGSNLRWNLVVEPEAVGDLTLSLPATEDCAAPRAVCTHDGRKLARGLSVTIEGPAAFSVSDAQVDEGSEAALAFEVSLSRRLRAEARVDVATRDGTATAGADYEAVTQTLVFARGETVKTVEVPVLDDSHDEGEETMTLVLSNATGAPIDDGEGTGTIVNADAIPKAWIARFGRTVTGQVLDAVEGRLAAPREAGGRMTVAGYALVAPDGSGGSVRTGGAVETPAQATAGDHASVAALGGWTNGARTGRSQALRERGMGGPEPQSLDITSHALVTGTAFTLSAGSAEGGGHGSLWGHASVAGFDGREDALGLDGEVTTGFLGADWATERWTAGLALGHSVGTGGYRNRECAGSAPADGPQGRGCGGRIEAALTGLYPYAGVDLDERVSVWLAGGHGAGALTVVPDGQGAIETDLAMRMGAAGTRVAVLEPEGGEGFNLALKGDGRFTRTSSDAARGPDGGNLAEAEADVWLLRFGLEGSRPFALGGSGAGDGTGASLTPSFEVGVRRDGGDAETGFGADMGGGVAFAAPQRGLRFDLKGRALVAHDAPGFREWGASAAFGFDPRPSTERGLALSLTQSWGAAPSGGMDALLGRETLAGPVANDDAGTGFTAPSRLSGELGYGLPAFGGGFTGTPNLGFGLSSGGVRDWRLGWRLTSALRGDSRFEVNLDATWREGAGEPAEHGAMLTGRFRW